jgi:hypothetical protein
MVSPIAMNKLKKVWLLFFLCFMVAYSQGQNIMWMIGTWEGTGDIPGTTKAHFIKTITIDSVSGENFIGKKTSEVDDRSHARIVTSIFGYYNQDQLNIQNGAVLYKNGPWIDCSSCTPINKITIIGDSLALSSRISGCQKYCDGVSVYYRSLCDYDSATQVYLVGLFGTTSDVASFKPCSKKLPELIASNADKQKHENDSINNAIALAKQRQKQIDDSIALAKKHQQHIDDSLRDVATITKQKEQQRIKDSINNATILAKQRQQQIDDSTKNAIALAKQRQQQIDDSIALAKKYQQHINDSLQNVATTAKQKEQQRIKDSINNAAILVKQRQQQIDDSTKNAIAFAKQRQQQIDDSISLAKKYQQHINDSLQNVVAIARQKEQQRIQDSISNAALIAKKRQQQIDDSTKNAIALAKQRQQQIDDSIALAKRIKQHIADSLQNIAVTARQKEQQRIQDSISNAALIAKKRQQQIDDSIALAKKYQQRINDSLQNVATITKQKEQQRLKDSISNAAILAKQRQQHIDDSTKNATALAKQRQKQIDDSIAVARKRQQHINDSLQNVATIAKQKEQQRIKDSINNAAVIAKQQQQQIDDSLSVVKKQQQIKRQEDSINNAAANVTKKAVAPGTDSAKTSTVKAFETRTNVLLQSYHITNPDILVELFDNAEIDGDRVSVYHNNVLIVNNQTLTHEPITFKIHADSSNRVHEFVMIAENLGTIPPNTALMRITVGTQTYKLGVKTDLQTNAKIVFYYDGN